MVIFFILNSSIALTCDQITQLETIPISKNSLTLKLMDDSLFASVTNINEEVKKEVSNSIAQFEFKISELAKKGVSKEHLADWYLNMTNLNRLAFDKIQSMGFLSDSKAKRLAATTVNTIVSGWISRALALTGHERAHTTVAEKLDLKFGYGHDSSPDKKMSLGTMFLALLTEKGNPFATWEADKPISENQKALFSIAGINFQNSLASDITTQNLRSQNIHATDAFHLLYNKAAIGAYYFVDKESDSSDLKQYVDSLEARGLIEPNSQDKTLEKLANLSILTTMLSGSTIDTIKANAEFIKSGNTSSKITTFDTRFGKVTLPEFDTFLNTTNASVKSSSALIRGKNIYQLSYEKPVIGDLSGEEVSFGAYQPINKEVYADGAIRYNTNSNSYGANLELGYELENGWQLVSGIDYEKSKNGGTWYGQRKYNYELEDGSIISGYLSVRKKF